MVRPEAALAIVIGLAVMAGGCASRDPYQLGVVEGCAQGYHDGGRPFYLPVNEGRLAADQAYAEGWHAGHGTCYRLEIATPQPYPIR